MSIVTFYMSRCWNGRWVQRSPVSLIPSVGICQIQRPQSCHIGVCRSVSRHSLAAGHLPHHGMPITTVVAAAGEKLTRLVT